MGFEKKPREIAEKIGLEEDDVRCYFFTNNLKEKIKEIERDGKDVNKGISKIEGSDNYILLIDEIESSFEILASLITIPLRIRDEGYIPLEIALDSVDISYESPSNIINNSTIISALKNDILTPYRKYYCDSTGQKIQSSFVVLTRKVYNDLDAFDKKICNSISYEKGEIFDIDFDKILQRTKLIKFLKEVGIQKSASRYTRIDELFVAPLGFQDIKQILNKYKAVIITGDKEVGKTFLSIRLLWEYFVKGYKPIWFSWENANALDTYTKLEDKITSLDPHTIILIDDLFGRIKYEEKEDVERGFETILDMIKTNDLHVIFTSRDEVFHEFLHKSHISPKDLVVNLKTYNHAYDFNKRKEMLINWAKIYDCKWLGTESLKKRILEFIGDEKRLPTPLNIHEFAFASKYEASEIELINKAEEKSVDTPRGFARDIRCMKDDRKLFLSFLFVSDWFTLEFINREYNKIAKELGIEANDFGLLLEYFLDTKIGIVSNYVRFLHPSYYESIRYILTEGRFPSMTNKKIFCPMLRVLSTEISATDDVVRMIAAFYDVFPSDTRNLLFAIVGRDIGRILILSHIIKSRKSIHDLDTDTRNILGKEGIFLCNCITAGRNLHEPSTLVHDNLIWDNIWRDLMQLENDTLTKSFEPFLSATSRIYASEGIRPEFYEKLSERVIDNRIRLLVSVHRRKNLKELIKLVLTDEELSTDITRIGGKITEQFLKKRVARLQSSGYVKIADHEIRATAKLIMKMSEKEMSIDASRKVGTYIEEASSPLRLSEGMKKKALKIANKVSNHYLLGGRDYQVVAAASINLASLTRGRNFTKSKLAETFHTNNDAINQVTKILLRIMEINRN